MPLHMELTRTGLGYYFAITDTLDPSNEMLRFEVASIAKTVWGVSGRVTVRSRITSARTVPNMKGNYVTTERIDFLSGRSRQAFAQRLAELIPAPPGGAAIDWDTVVEELTAGVMDAEHRQPVLRDLSEVKATPVTPHLYPYLLPSARQPSCMGLVARARACSPQHWRRQCNWVSASWAIRPSRGMSCTWIGRPTRVMSPTALPPLRGDWASRQHQ